MSDIVKIMLIPIRGPGGSVLRVEDLFLLDDLKALDLPWVTELASVCESHEDVKMLWTLLRAWGPDNEDVEELLVVSRPSSQRRETADRVRRLVRIVEGWHP
jgi:hypothetical protein